MTSGTTVASEPVDLPTIILVTGISMMMPMMKGRERTMLTTKETASYTPLLGVRPPLPVWTSTRPSSVPMTTAKTVDRPVIMRVSKIAGTNFWVRAGLSSHVGSPLPVGASTPAALAAAR